MSKIVSVPCNSGVLGSVEVGRLAASALSDGHVIAVPTDTIYGLAALVQNPTAVNKLYDIKGRDYNKPISICVAKTDHIFTWAKVTVSDCVLKKLLPGPVTLVFNRKELLNKNFNPETNLVGVRIPNHTFMRSVCELSEGPIALTSANYSEEKSTVAVEEFSHLYSSLHTVFDGGRLGNTAESRLGSTVADLSIAGTYKILRPGCALNFLQEVMSENGIIQRA